MCACAVFLSVTCLCFWYRRSLVHVSASLPASVSRTHSRSIALTARARARSTSAPAWYGAYVNLLSGVPIPHARPHAVLICPACLGEVAEPPGVEAIRRSQGAKITPLHQGSVGVDELAGGFDCRPLGTSGGSLLRSLLTDCEYAPTYVHAMQACSAYSCVVTFAKLFLVRAKNRFLPSSKLHTTSHVQTRCLGCTCESFAIMGVTSSTYSPGPVSSKHPGIAMLEQQAAPL